MSTLELETEPAAIRADVTADRLVVHLQDGRILSVPLGWYPRLQHATESERQNSRLLGNGYAIEWPDLDEHIGVEGLVAGRKSGESETSLRRWLSTRGASH
jgi:hypothetical protein